MRPGDHGHRLRALLADAARGRFPPADGSVEVVGPPSGRSDAVVAFSAHNVVAADVAPEEVFAHLASDDPGAPMAAPFLTWLGGRLGAEPGMLDVVLVALASGETPIELLERTDLSDHARVARSLRYRREVRVYGDAGGAGVVTIGSGLAGRFEVSIDVDPVRRNHGLGTSLARAATSLVPAGEPLFAQVSPGNVASVRTFLKAGYEPVCSEVLFLRSSAL